MIENRHTRVVAPREVPGAVVLADADESGFVADQDEVRIAVEIQVDECRALTLPGDADVSVLPRNVIDSSLNCLFRERRLGNRARYRQDGDRKNNEDLRGLPRVHSFNPFANAQSSRWRERIAQATPGTAAMATSNSEQERSTPHYSRIATRINTFSHAPTGAQEAGWVALDGCPRRVTPPSLADDSMRIDNSPARHILDRKRYASRLRMLAAVG